MQAPAFNASFFSFHIKRPVLLRRLISKTRTSDSTVDVHFFPAWRKWHDLYTQPPPPPSFLSLSPLHPCKSKLHDCYLRSRIIRAFVFLFAACICSYLLSYQSVAGWLHLWEFSSCPHAMGGSSYTADKWNGLTSSDEPRKVGGVGLITSFSPATVERIWYDMIWHRP